MKNTLKFSPKYYFKFCKVYIINFNILNLLILNFISYFQFILACLAAVAFADKPSSGYGAPDSAEHIPILRDDRTHEDGAYSTSVETGNGIYMAEAGQPTGPEDAVVAAGSYS